MTVREYSQQSGIPESKVRKMLKSGQIMGKLIPAGRVDGRLVGDHWEVMADPEESSPSSEGTQRERHPRPSARGTGRGRRWPRSR